MTDICLSAGRCEWCVDGSVFMVVVLLLPYNWNFFLVCAVSGGSYKAVQ